MDSKTRSILRGKATQIDAVFQIGIDGVTENVIDAVDKALTARELIKVTVLKNSPVTPREALDMLAKATGAEGICTVGQKVVLYRVSNKRGIKHVLEI